MNVHVFFLKFLLRRHSAVNDRWRWRSLFWNIIDATRPLAQPRLVDLFLENRADVASWLGLSQTVILVLLLFSEQFLWCGRSVRNIDAFGLVSCYWQSRLAAFSWSEFGGSFAGKTNRNIISLNYFSEVIQEKLGFVLVLFDLWFSVVSQIYTHQIDVLKVIIQCLVWLCFVFDYDARLFVILEFLWWFDWLASACAEELLFLDNNFEVSFVFVWLFVAFLSILILIGIIFINYGYLVAWFDLDSFQFSVICLSFTVMS